MAGQGEQHKAVRKRYECPVQDCIWTGTKHIHYHLPKIHGMTLEQARRIAQEAATATPKEQDDGGLQESVNNFTRWLGSMEGGKYIAPTLPKHEQKEKKRRLVLVKRVIEETTRPKFHKNTLKNLSLIGKTTEDGTSVLIRIKENFKLKWGSIKGHLVSLGHFVKYLRSLKLEWCSEATIDDIGNVQTRCLTSASKMHNREEFERKRLEIGTEITPEQCTSVLSSDLMSNTFTYFSTFRPVTQQVKEADYTKHLNELILCMQQTNGKRSGTLADLRKSEVSNAKTVQGMKVAYVSSGKTVQTYGPSTVVFIPEVYSTVKDVRDKVHKVLGNHDHLFSTYSGTPMTEKQITRSVHNFFFM